MRKVMLLILLAFVCSRLSANPIVYTAETDAITITSLPHNAIVTGDVQIDLPLIEAAEHCLTLDGKVVFFDTEDFEGVWQPQKLGEQTLTYTAGRTTLERTVNVTGFSYATPTTPNPPMSLEPAIAIMPPTRSFGIDGGAYAIVTSGSGAWTAATSHPWITLLNETCGTVGYPVAYSVSNNPNVEKRVGYVYVSGHVHTITQAGVGATVSPLDATFECEGGMGQVSVVTQNQAGWQARSNADWISVSSTSGEGEKSLSYSVAPLYQVTTRQATLTVAGNEVTILQYGRPMQLESYSISRDWHAQTIPITVNALAITEWSVTSNASWISVVDTGNGKGDDLVTIAITENTSYRSRTGSVTIGTEIFTVKQAGCSNLVFSASPEGRTVSVDGANGLISVTATPDLPWSATSDSNWMLIYGNTATGSGNGNVVYSVLPQSTLYERTGIITITSADGRLPKYTHIVKQPAATSSLSISGYEFEAIGESCAIDVSLADVVAWEVVENLNWLTVIGSTSRVGPGTVTLQVSANTTLYPRSGTVKIAEKTFTVTQKGRGIAVEYDNKLFGTDGGIDSIFVYADKDVAWKAVVSDPTWITVFSGASGTGNGEIQYIVSPYFGDSGVRTGTITVGDKVIYITQRTYDLTINPCSTTVTSENGSGEFGVSASIADAWTVVATEPWITIVEGYDAGSGNGTVRFTYTENDTGKMRTGKIIVAGEVYTIQQAPRQLVNVVVIAERGGLATGSGSYYEGDSVTLTAIADEGFVFCGWSTIPMNGNETLQLTVPGEDLTLTAYFMDASALDVYLQTHERVSQEVIDARVKEVITERGLLTRAELKALAKDSPVVEVKNGVATLKVNLKQATSLEELSSNAVDSPQQLNIKVPDDEKVLLYKVVKPSKE